MRLWHFLWLAMILTLSLAPTEMKFRLGTMGAFHNWGHFGIFLLTAVIVLWNASGVRSKSGLWLLVLALGALLEWLEAVVYHNPIEWQDILTDCMGAFAGFVLLLLKESFISPGQRSSSDLT